MKTLDQISLLALLPLLLAGCGQPGPLYLPKDAPNVYSQPKPVEQTSNEQAEKKQTGNKADASLPASTDKSGSEQPPVDK